MYDVSLSRLNYRTFATLIAVAACLAVGSSIQAQTTQTENRVVVTAPELTPTPHPQDDTRPKLEHIMREVSGTQITVTKKATVIKLDKQPPVENNNLQELFSKAPGLLVSEQQNPGQFNYSYRGLGNPQESEYTLFLHDGLPLMSEWIGFPTLYYQPFPQSVSEIQLIRGGSSLLYGPEPAPAVNFVSKRPAPGSPWQSYMEQVGGSDGFYSSYASVQEATGPFEMRLDAGYQTSEGQRDNGEYHIWQADGYFGYRPDDKQLIAVDVHASRFNGGDPGKINIFQFDADQNFATTPYNENWVDRYTAVLRYELEFGDGWLMQAKGWYTHQDIDARSGANLTNPPNTGFTNPTQVPGSTTFGYEEFNNGGVDLRFRKKWGDDTMFRGSALTFGGVAYHGDAPFTRYTLTQDNTGNPGFLYSPRGTTVPDGFTRTGTMGLRTIPNIPLEQDRTADYQAVFIENVFRLGKFHIVPSFRLDHENVEVDSAHAPWLSPPLPPRSPLIRPNNVSADHWIPLWGIGLGNDFAGNNETYFSATSGWRPTRFFDIAGTTRTISPDVGIPDPFESLDIELGVHGTPIKGLWYDVGLFWMEFSNRTENQAQGTIDFEIVNTGNTRHRGFEGEISYDLLAPFQQDVVPVPDPKDSKNVVAPIVSHPLQLVVFTNIQLLDAEFTESVQIVPNSGGRTFVGNEPAYAPDVIWKGGVSFRKEKCFNFTLSGVYVSDQFWADSNAPVLAPGPGGIVLVPAVIPSYTVFNFSAEWYLTRNVRLIAGISNLADEKYYSRAFLNGLIDPAPGRSAYAGLSVEF
jgi:Fe(3+) dicitrate transport protein